MANLLITSILFSLTMSLGSALHADEAKTETMSEAKSETKSETKKEAKKEMAKASEKKGAKMTTVVMETSLGNVEIELNGEKAPKTVENFLKYVEAKQYDGTIFHRVIKDFMIQGGGMDEKMNEKKTGKPIQNEANNGLQNLRGSIAMARTGDPHSATAQFFINTVDNAFLNFRSEDVRGWGYAVFGKVTSGMDVVDKIRAVETGTIGGMEDVPKSTVTIKSIRKK